MLDNSVPIQVAHNPMLLIIKKPYRGHPTNPNPNPNPNRQVKKSPLKRDRFWRAYSTLKKLNVRYFRAYLSST